MPTYQYRCKECDHEFEVVQSFSDDPLESCPECTGRLKKVYGNVGISFKGSGFYKTDSRGAKAPAGGSATKESAGTGDSSDSSTKSDGPSGDKKAPASDTSSSGSSGSAGASSGSSGSKPS